LPLGDWYANFLAARPQRLAICVNERSLLTVLVPLAPRTGFIDRFREAARQRIEEIPAPHDAVAAAVKGLQTIRIGRATNRSVIGSLNNLRQLALWLLRDNPVVDPDTLAWRLCETPMLTLQWGFPWEEAVRLLGGGREVGHRKRKDAT
jgi:hypothetical protein